jgi:acyl-CoA synthetase (AMP-forming)/AMP-acid ligase II
MARRQQKRLVEPTTLAGLFLTLGTIWLIAQLLHNLPSGTVSAFAWVILAAAAAAMVYPVIRLLRRAGARQALLLKASV